MGSASRRGRVGLGIASIQNQFITDSEPVQKSRRSNQGGPWGSGSGRMALPWQTSKGPSIGLRAQKFPYGHLHEQLPRDASAEREMVEMAEADIYAPPRSDSDEKSPSPPLRPALKPETPPPAKRRRLETRSSQRIDLTSPSSIKKEGGLADIPKTIFTSSAPSSNHYSGAIGKNVPASSSQPYNAVRDDTDVPLFAAYEATKTKTRKKYARGPVNIHKAATVKPEKQQGTIKHGSTEPMIKSQPDGFRIANTERLCALVPPSPEKELMKAEFKRPAGCSPSPRSERASRHSTQEEDANGLRLARPKTLKKPTLVPSSPKRESPPRPEFKVPKGLSPSLDDRRSRRSNRSSQDALVPDAPIAPRLTDLKGFADNIANTAKIKLDIVIPESSATVSSGPNLDFDVGDGNSTSSLSSAPEIEELDALDFPDGVLKAHPPSLPKSKCPLCNSNIRQQAMFCKAHKIRSAQDLWGEKGYPAIEWKEFQARLP
ncbi:MAG: hypothetical protein Q9226_009114, partial [Calogaya cf. arnoldii]